MPLLTGMGPVLPPPTITYENNRYLTSIRANAAKRSYAAQIKPERPLEHVREQNKQRNLCGRVSNKLNQW